MKAGGMITNGRKECPKCGRKGVGFARHPHAFGYKDYTRARCRYCGAVFQLNGDPFNPELLSHDHTQGEAVNPQSFTGGEILSEKGAVFQTKTEVHLQGHSEET